MKKVGFFWFVALIVAVASSASAQTFSTLASFDGADGNQPEWMSLIQATDGNLYGTTLLGGAYGYGEIFRISPAGGKPVSIYSFCKNFAEQGYCSDGADPDTFGVLQGADGDLYGTTGSGGSYSGGTFYKITLTGHLTTEYLFCSLSNCADGRIPGPIIQAANGDFYGTTEQGGAYGYGSVFEITSEGVLTTLHSFCATLNTQNDCSDGNYPSGGVIQGTDGNFYGTTIDGGNNGVGTIFKITSAGVFSTLYNFCSLAGCADGYQPHDRLIQGTDGDFYGTTYAGGTSEPTAGGTIFKITSTGSLTTLYSFCAQYADGCLDGDSPYTGLIQGSDGNFYGTTFGGGSNCEPGGCGTAFELTPSGSLTTLYNFCSLPGCADGYQLTGGLAQATNGTFYGTAQLGGADGDGTVFSISTGLGSFVQTNPTADKVGKSVKILGAGLTGSTAVSFDGVAATTFKVVSSSEMTATVPTGALTGTLSVTTPSGTLNSNGPFYVTPQLTKFSPTSGDVGATVAITGVSLTQTSAVSFNGVSATFTVNSDTDVTTTVPTGATTGPITITTAGGTVTSKSKFTVK